MTDIASKIQDVVAAGQQPRTGTQQRLQFHTDADGVYHVLDDDFVRKVLKDHGDPASEAARGNLPVVPADFLRIPEIVSTPDSKEAITKNGIAGVRYVKRLNGTVYYVETGPNKNGRQLAKTMWKKPNPPQQSPH